MAGTAGTGAGVGTRSDALGAGVGGAGVDVGCACEESGVLDGEVDLGFAGREGWRELPAAVADATGLACSTAVSCAPGVEVPVTAAAALARARAMRSAWRARVFLRISILLSSCLTFFTKSFTSPGLKEIEPMNTSHQIIHPEHALEKAFEVPQVSVPHLPNLREGR